LPIALDKSVFMLQSMHDTHVNDIYSQEF